MSDGERSRTKIDGLVNARCLADINLPSCCGHCAWSRNRRWKCARMRECLKPRDKSPTNQATHGLPRLPTWCAYARSPFPSFFWCEIRIIFTIDHTECLPCARHHVISARFCLSDSVMLRSTASVRLGRLFLRLRHSVFGERRLRNIAIYSILSLMGGDRYLFLFVIAKPSQMHT